MLKGKWDILDKMNNRKVIVGYDLDDSCSQISYWNQAEEDTQTVSLVAGEEIYNIPTVLCKRKGVNQWYYGKEAIKYAKEEQVELLENLVSNALEEKEVVVEDRQFSSIALLTLFMKRSLSLLSMEVGARGIGALMITCRKLSPKMVEVLNLVVKGLDLKTECISFQSHVESMYYYLLYQSEELRKDQVVVYDRVGLDIKTYRAECNRKTTPVVVFIYEEDGVLDFFSLTDEEKDAQLAQLAESICTQNRIQTSYLIGQGFDEEWMKSSTKVLCRNKRLFMGNNMYSKGACYAMREKLTPGKLSQEYVFLGDEKLKSNLGMKVKKQGEDSYFALLDAGENWYEARKECEFYLDNGKEFEIIITPLDGKETSMVSVVLEGMLERPQAGTRLFVTLNMTDDKTVKVIVKDLGFGDIYPASQYQWTKEILLN